MSEVNANGHDEYARIAGGLGAQLDQFGTFYGLKLAGQVFAASEHLSTVLQGKETNAQQAQQAATQVVKFYQKMRTPEKFTEHFNAIVQDSEGKTQSPTLPRYRKMPKRLDDGSEEHRFGTVEEYYKQAYFEVLDLLVAELSRRFSQKSFGIVGELESMFLDAANGKEYHIPDTVMDLYKEDVDFKRLEFQLRILPDTIKSVSFEKGCSVKKVTIIDTIVDTLNSSSVLKRMFSEVSVLLRIYLTIPVTTASSERSFSCLRRLKTYLRSTMTQQRLNNILLLHTNKDLTDELCLAKIAEEFVTVNDRRRGYFGTFKI